VTCVNRLGNNFLYSSLFAAALTDLVDPRPRIRDERLHRRRIPGLRTVIAGED
jgi:hypothetical protein